VTRPDIPEALAALDELTRRLRRECPWDREQDERSIVPHTVEEAYELAAAALGGDDRKLIDELGDVLFQVLFLSLLLEERGAGDLAAVAAARARGVDPELALRSAADRFKARIEQEVGPRGE
jgi:ATP diphosphatase